MIPQILTQLSGGLKISPQIKQMFQMLQSSWNPQAMISQLMQNNPQMGQVFELIKASGNDPKRAFYTLAEKRGIDPNMILDQLK